LIDASQRAFALLAAASIVRAQIVVQKLPVARSGNRVPGARQNLRERAYLPIHGIFP
jgi:hypothetical protein